MEKIGKFVVLREREGGLLFNSIKFISYEYLPNLMQTAKRACKKAKNSIKPKYE